MKTIMELAKVIIEFDTSKSCPFCDKDEWARFDDHMHDNSCLFAIAYQNDEISTEQAADKALSLGIDDAVRVIAKSVKNYDRGRGPNYYANWGEMRFSATFGAGTNSAEAVISDTDFVLYKASGYGRTLEIFRHGPWVQRMLNYATTVREENEMKAEHLKTRLKAEKSANFQEVDF